MILAILNSSGGMQSHYIHCIYNKFGMEKRGGQSGDFDKPNWDWTQVQCSLKTVETGRKSVHWQLAPSILLTNPNSVTSDPVVRLFIDTQKSLSYSQDLGWNWHKSWNLPNISIRLEIKDDITGEQLLSPKNVFAQLFAVKKNGDNDRNDKLALLDVGIRGQSKMEMIDGQVYFSAMKFSSTTYNNEGQNFHLLIVIYIQENETDKPKVLTAVLSPEIFVDSRRSARDYQEKKFNSFVEPFSPDQLDKEFIKRESKIKAEQEIEIKNDSEGFYNYLTAPNIRHKVKHPLFLAIRFSNCASIYYNTEKFPKGQNFNVSAFSKDLLENLQKKLLKESQGKNVRQEEAIPSGDRLFIFSVKNVNDTLKRKKVMESIETLESQSIGIYYGDEEATGEFENMVNLGSLGKIYRENYETLKEICRKYVPSDADSSDYESDEEYGENQKKPKPKPIENVNNISGGQNAKRAKAANIVCQTIPTIDKAYNGKDSSSKQNERKKGQQVAPPQQQVYDGSAEQGIKEEEQERMDLFYPVPENNINQIRNNNVNISNGNPPNNMFLHNISSKKTAFSNPRNEEKQSNELNGPNSNPLNQNINQPNYPNMNPNNLNLLSELQGLASGLNGLNGGMGGLGGGMNALGGIPGLGGMGNLGGNMNNGMANALGALGNGYGAGLNGMGLNNFGAGGLGGLMGGLGSLGGLGGLNLGGFQGLNPAANFNYPNNPNTGANQYGGNVGNQYGNNPGQGNQYGNNPGQGNQFGNNAVNGNQFGNNPGNGNQSRSNLVLSNWLNSVKNNNMNLYETMKGGQPDGQPTRNQGNFKGMNEGNQDEMNNMNNMNRLNPQLQEQQSMLCLMQQINLYRELLTQVTYQNQLLGRNLGQGPNMNGVSREDMPQNPQMGQRNSFEYRNNFQSRDSESREPKEQPK